MSICHGGYGYNNLALLTEVRKTCPDDYLVYKPHPDVLSTNRKGYLPDKEILKFADQIIKDAAIGVVLSHVHEVHTITSGVGFDALIRNKTVYTYGMPFYAGWGLTNDRQTQPRRTKRLTLSQLVAGVLILYPMYYNPESREQCEPKDAINYLAKQKARLKKSLALKVWVKLNGYILPRIRNLIKPILLKWSASRTNKVIVSTKQKDLT
jgi:capsular polysaccharide export protein